MNVAALDVVAIAMMLAGVLAVVAAVVGELDDLNARANGSLLLAALGIGLIVSGAVLLT